MAEFLSEFFVFEHLFIFLGWDFQDVEVFLENNKESTWSNKYFKLLVLSLDKEVCVNKFLDKLWLSVIECHIGWAYFRFLQNNQSLNIFLGDIQDLPTGNLAPINQERRVCLLLARNFSTHHVFKISLEITLKVRESLYVITNTCNTHKYNHVLEVYNILNAGLCKYSKEVFWIRVLRAAEDAGMVTSYIQFLTDNGFWDIVKLGKERMDEGKAAGGSSLDPSNPL